MGDERMTERTALLIPHLFERVPLIQSSSFDEAGEYHSGASERVL